MVDQGSIVLDSEDHGMVVVGPYVGMVAEVRGNQGASEALGEVVGQAPEEAVDMEFLLKVGVWKSNMEHGEEEHGEEKHGEEEHGEKEEKHGEEVGLKASGEET